MDAHATPPPPKDWPEWEAYTTDEAPWWLLALRLYQRRIVPRQVMGGFTKQDLVELLGPEPKAHRSHDPEDPAQLAHRTRYYARKERLQAHWDLAAVPEWHPFDTRPLEFRDWRPKSLQLQQTGRDTLALPWPPLKPGRWQRTEAGGWERNPSTRRFSADEIQTFLEEGTHTHPPQTLLVAVESDRLAAFLEQAERFLVLVRLASTEDRTFRPVQGPPLVLHQPILELEAATPIMDPTSLLQTSWADARGRNYPVPGTRKELDELYATLKVRHPDGIYPDFLQAPEWRQLVAFKLRYQDILSEAYGSPLWRPILWPSPAPKPWDGPESELPSL